MQLSQTDQHRQEGRKENEREKQVELLLRISADGHHVTGWRHCCWRWFYDDGNYDIVSRTGWRSQTPVQSGELRGVWISIWTGTNGEGL